MKKPIGIGIIGLGRWGTNYFRTFNELENCDVKYICATRDKTLSEAIKKISPNKTPKATLNYKDMLNYKEIDAVAIATNGASHYKLAKEALEAGKHVLVEKPVAFSSKDAKMLMAISRKKGKILMAGHQHLYNPGIRKIKEDIKKGLFGKINFINLTHFGNGPIRTDMSALWDFFPHSVSILLYLLDDLPTVVCANGKSYVNKGVEDVVTMEAAFPNGIFAVSTASWLYPLKKMEIVVIGQRLCAAFDDYAKNGKLKYYHSRPKAVKGKIAIGRGFKAAELKDARPLTEQLSHFLYCIEKNKEPLTGAEEALNVTKVLEVAEKSLKMNGLPIKVG